MGRNKRGKPFRKVKPEIVIVCEDSVSAPAYFSAITIHFHDDVLLRVDKKQANRTAPDQVVERAIQAKSEKSEADIKEDGDQFWAIIDADYQAGAPRDKQMVDALRKAKKNGINVAISNPCFEHWLHLHLEDCDGGHFHAKDAIGALDVTWKNRFDRPYEKGCKKIKTLVMDDQYEAARCRAKKQHGVKDNAKSPHECQPCVTDLYRLFDAIDELVAARKKAT